MTQTDEQDEVYEMAALWALRLSADHSDADLSAFADWACQNPLHLKLFNEAEASLAALETHKANPRLVEMRSAALKRARPTPAQPSSKARFMPSRRYFAAAAAGIIAAPLAATWWLSRKPVGDVYSTAIAEQRAITLADGSEVMLDAMTEMSVAYSPKLRLITLSSGRAYFTVAKDPQRPFRVEAGHRAVVALGTAFSLERQPAGMLVTLAEGRVAVSDDLQHQLVELTPNQSVWLSDHAAPIKKAVDITRALSWREGLIVFDDVSLTDAVARMNTYSHTPIEIREGGETQKGIGALRLSGTFTAGDSQSFAEAMAAYFDMQVTRSGAAIILQPAKRA